MTQVGEHITTQQLAERLNRSPATLIRWRRQRVGPPYVRIEGRVVYDPAKVAAWLDQRTVEASH